MKVFSPFLNGNTTTSGSLTLPRHPISSSITNPNTGSIYHDTTDNVVKVYTGNAWEVVGAQTAPSTGPASADIEYVVVAGGGGGGKGYYGGGGGAGGYLSSSLSSVTSGSTFTITVGGAGSAATSDAADGGNGVDSSIAGSSITTITAVGGGGGASRNSDPGADGGSGGGAAVESTYGGGAGSGTVGQGNDGGVGAGDYGAGGGGAGEAGISSSGNGGAGLASTITGASVTRAGGGGGGGLGSTYPVGSGGAGGGGAGGDAVSYPSSNGPGSNGTGNTGGGGGGGGGTANGGSGGSGVAIFAYPSASINAVGGIVGDAGNGIKYNQFNSSGTLNVGSTSDFGIVTSNLQLHYDAGNFSSRGTSTFTDLSSNGFNGTVSGATLNQEFYYDFDGSNDLISFSSNGLHTSLKAFEIWFNADSWNGGSYFPFQIGNGQGVEHFLYLDGGGTNYMTVRIGNAQAREAYSATNTWIHMAATINGSNLVELYRNGSLVATSSSSPSAMSNDTCYLGARNNLGTGAWFNGKIAQLRIYSQNLSAAQIAQNYNATKTNFT